MNFKFGGSWIRGDYEFRITPTWPRHLVTRADGECNSHYKVLKSTYDMVGKGWATSDWGESKGGFIDQIQKCTGKVKNLWWHYCELDECDGWDWKMSFETNVFVRKRCFDNLKVHGASGGYTHKYGHDYPVWGCSGSD